MAAIRRRGKYWQAQVRKKGFPARSATFDTKVEAREWANDVERDMRRGRFRDSRPTERTTLGEAVTAFAEERAAREPNAWREQNRAVRISKYPLGQYAVANVRGREIADYIDQREAEGRSANTIRLDLALIGRMFEIARKEWDWPVEHPVRDVRKPSVPRGRERRLNEGEEKKLLEASRPQFRAVIHWALETAMRREEIATLRWSHVDTLGRTAHLPKTKNGDARTVPLSRRALAILRVIPRRQDRLVFGMSPNAITLAMRRATAAAGIEELRFHDLRHEAVSRLFERTNLDAMQISRISGHRTMQMLSRYAHLRAGDLARELDRAVRTGQTRRSAHE